MRHRDDKFPDNGFEAWGGYMNAKISKLEEQFSSRAKNHDLQLSNIFSGVSIFVNGYTVPSTDELKTLMSKHGGIYHTYQRNEDYIIASNLPDTKVKKMCLSKVVKPEWITDSIASNELLDYRNYLLFKNSKTQAILNFKAVKDESNLVPLDNNNTHNFKHKGIDRADLLTDINDKSLSPCTNSNVTAKINVLLQDSTNVDIEVSKNNQSTKTAADPNFISEFYSNSRLHHISQLGACFKQHVNDLREKSDFVFRQRTTLIDRIQTLNNTTDSTLIQFESDKTIMHIDMDCFFVSVGLRQYPELRGKPVAVTHSKGGQPRSKRPGVDRNTEFNMYRQKHAKKLGKTTEVPEDKIQFKCRVDGITEEDDKYGSMSEIASCSYEARAKGVSNGMFMGMALKMCPDLQTIPYNFEGYTEVAYTLYNTIAQYTLDIEAVSCDEMYVDCTELLNLMGISVQDFATVLRNEIKVKTGCPCSTGFGGNRLQARMATKKAKPDGQFFLTAELVRDFMFGIELRELPGVGRQTAQKLESIGHKTCGSLQSLSLASLKTHFGIKAGAQLFEQCRGHDPNPLSFHTVRKSVSAEVNYGIRFENEDQCEEFLKQLSAEVHSRLQQFKVLGKCLTLKLMIRAKDAPVETAKFLGHGFCDVINKSTSLNVATQDIDIITREIISLCRNQKVNPREMRGIGIQITKLEALNSKKNRGPINKFFKSNNTIKRLENTHTSNAQITKKIKTEIPITPTKPKTVQSPRRKSPIVAPNKSPIGKRRGRPSKSAKLSTSKNLMDKFVQGQSTVKDTLYRNPMISIFKEEINDTFKNDILNRPDEKEKISGRLIGLSWQKVRELLRAWLESGQSPLPCDVSMITDYLQDMVVNYNIDKVRILINFLRRRTNELKSREWTEVYNTVVKRVQDAMIAVYGNRLYVDD